MPDDSLYRRVARAAAQPPGGIPDGWQLLGLSVYGDYHPDTGQWWNAVAEFGRNDRATGTRRLIGAGPSVGAALIALQQRLADPLSTRRKQTKGGWDTRLEPGRVVQQP